MGPSAQGLLLVWGMWTLSKKEQELRTREGSARMTRKMYCLGRLISHPCYVHDGKERSQEQERQIPRSDVQEWKTTDQDSNLKYGSKETIHRILWQSIKQVIKTQKEICKLAGTHGNV